MGVTGHDGRKAGRGRIQVELREIVEYMDAATIDLDNFGRGKTGRPRPGVDVAPNGECRSESTESFEDLRISDVAGVN
jgi:hypothetical protein